MTDLEGYIARYAALGWSLMLIPPGQKKTTDQGWPTAPDEPDNLLRAVRAGGDWNLAVRLGERSGYLADVDLDSDAARLLAPTLLPATSMLFGRTSAAHPTHRLYVCPDGPLGNGTVSLTGQASLRWNGAYTVFPPSTHPDGSDYQWLAGTVAASPPAVGWATLLDATREVAAGALLLGVYPTWQQMRLRHYSTLALAAALLRAGWALPRVERFIYAVAVAAGDEEADARVTNARTTADRLARGEQLGGWSALVSNAGADLVKQLQRFLAIDAYASSGGAWAGVVSGQGGQGSTGQASTPKGNTPSAPTTAQSGAQRSQQGPGQAASQAPVFATAQQAAQQAAKAPQYNANEVAFMVAAAVTKATPVAKDEGQGLYLYDAGVYAEDPGEMRLRRLIQKEVISSYGLEFLSPELAADVLYHIRVNVPAIEVRPERGWLNLANGRLELATLTLHSHTPDVRTTVKLPVSYDQRAGCPHIEHFCAQVFPADAYAKGIPWEVVALCLFASKGIDKAILLLGDGENGKGIFLDLMRTLVGPTNTSAVALQRIGDNRFATADLRGKLLNVSMDLPSKRLEDSGDFKAIVSGELIRAERKNQPAFTFEPFCRLLYSANNLPESVDTSRGYTRRWHIIPFDVTFDLNNPDRRPRNELFEAMTTPEELSGLLNLALPALVAFERGAQPESSDSMDATIEEFRDILDPFPLWVRTQLQESPQGWIETRMLATKYRERVERRGRTVLLSDKQVGKAIKEAFPSAVPEQRRVGGTGRGIGQSQGQPTAKGPARRGWRGVSWNLGATP